MNFIRTSVLGRGQAQEEGLQPGQQRPSGVEEQSGSRPLNNSRSPIPRLFARLPSLGAQAPLDAGESDDDGFKFPNRFRPSSFARSRTQDVPNQPSSETGTHDSRTPSQPPRARTHSQRFPILTRPRAARTNREPERNVRRSTFNGSNLAELHLASHVEDGRRRRRDHSGSSRRRQHKEPPTRFLFCFPWIKSRRVRSLVLHCFVLGLFLITTLTIYLSLSITKRINSLEFSTSLIFFIIVLTLFFCFALLRLCVEFVGPRKRQYTLEVDVEANKYGHPGYAVPAQPIRVVLARDEEAAGIESEAARLKPPAYGLWRESVRVDPDRIYWQRAQSPPPSSPTTAPSFNEDEIEGDGRRTAQHRPPSYASEDGVDYVVDARPRSIAPPPSSIYSQSSTMGTPVISNAADVPPLPDSAILEVYRPGGRITNQHFF